MGGVRNAVKRNGAVDVYKFIFCWMIAFLHFYGNGKHFPRGDLGVEFFVIISGVYFFDACMKLDKNSAGGGYYGYIHKRYLRFFPYTFFAFLLSFFVNRIWINSVLRGNALSLHAFADFFANDVTEIFLIKMTGLSANADGFSDFLNAPVWTVSAMLLVEFVIISLLSYRKESFYKVICPVSIIIGLGVWNNASNLRVGAWLGFCSAGVLRVFVLTCISYYCCELSALLRKQKFTAAGRGLLTVTEACCVAAFIAIIMLSRSGGRKYNWLAILLAFVACAISTSGNGLCRNILKGNRVTEYLGRLSFAVFLMHMPILNLFQAYFPNIDIMYSHKFVFIAVVLAMAMAFEFIMKYVLRLCDRAAERLKYKIICKE